MWLKGINTLLYLFILYVIVISFTPLLPLYGWQGYGPAGEFYYTGERIHIRYNDPGFPNDKPHIFIADAGRTISLLEFSGHHSAVNGSNLYFDFSTKTRLLGDKLLVFYNSPSISFVQVVEPSKGNVRVKYTCNCTMELTLTLWRWYFSSIEDFDRPVTRSLKPADELVVKITEGGKTFKALLVFSPTPKEVEISGEIPHGLNKITLRFIGREISINLVLHDAASDAGWIPLIDIRGGNHLYPVTAVVASMLYLMVYKKSRGYS
jgi:hypothetical protein